MTLHKQNDRQKVKQKGRRADALALRAEERRDKLRKAAGRSTYPLIRGCLNGETRQERHLSSVRESIACGGEPGELKHLSSRRKRKKHRFSKSRRANGKEPKPGCEHSGVRTAISEPYDSGTVLEKPAGEGESPVSERRDDKEGSRVHRDTRNLDGMSGDHPVSLNTT